MPRVMSDVLAASVSVGWASAHHRHPAYTNDQDGGLEPALRGQRFRMMRDVLASRFVGWASAHHRHPAYNDDQNGGLEPALRGRCLA